MRFVDGELPRLTKITYLARLVLSRRRRTQVEEWRALSARMQELRLDVTRPVGGRRSETDGTPRSDFGPRAARKARAPPLSRSVS